MQFDADKRLAALKDVLERSIDEKVRFLRAPEAYPSRPSNVEVVETHWSWVFIAGEHVYKLKKPVVSEYFDFTYLDAREANCRKEVLLNRRLAGDVYEGVAALAVDPSGVLSIGGAGKIIDWLVVMRRLPADRMLDQLISRKSFDPRQLHRLAERLAGFYAGQPSSAIRPEAYVARFTREQAINRVMLAKIDGERLAAYMPLLDRLDAALTCNCPLLEDRVRWGRIVDGHGDLRPEHICLTNPIVIFDCLEFNDGLRQVDPVDELTFLGLECAMLGAPSVGRELTEEVLTRLGQSVPEQLASFCMAFRALLRARLSLAHLLDAVPRQPEKWRPLADRYAAFAASALADLGV